VPWLIAGVALLLFLPVTLAVVLVGLHVWLRIHYLDKLMRIFQEKPLFVIPRGQPQPDAEEVTLTTAEGLKLHGCYLPTTAPRRKGVILFGLEFGANRWSCVPYCEDLRAAGYDVFALEWRNQGDSDVQPDYEPLPWVCDRDTADCRTALEYLKTRPDADPRGVGLFGISKGGGAGLVVMADDPAIRCAVTDGAFATYSTMVPYARVWFAIYNTNYAFHGLLWAWYYGWVAKVGIAQAGRERGVKFLSVEKAVRRLGRRPWLMIHGADDTYIKATMARDLFRCARGPKELWVVPGAKHNQALNLVGDEYKRRLREFFDRHLAGEENGEPGASGSQAALAERRRFGDFRSPEGAECNSPGQRPG
jgi:alpha-beta hydrolase superfamily lysophospholipase